MEEVVGYLFNLEVTVPDQPRVGIVRDTQGQAIVIGAPDQESPQERSPQPTPDLRAPGLETPQQTPLTYTAPDEDGKAHQSGDVRAQVRADDPYAGVGRNQQCPCGSGKKFKYCHGKKS